MSSDNLEKRIQDAFVDVSQRRAELSSACGKIGMVRAYVGEDTQAQLQYAIEGYARAVARHEMLTILSTEDFFVAMARSAGAVSSQPS